MAVQAICACPGDPKTRVSPPETTKWRCSTNPPRNYSYAWGSGADVNEHVSHIMNYIGPFADSDWDASTTGHGGMDGRDTMTACSNCHNVHGAVGLEGSTNEPMVRDGNLLNSTPHFTEICKALGSRAGDASYTGHGIACPCDCDDNDIHFYHKTVGYGASLGMTYLV